MSNTAVGTSTGPWAQARALREVADAIADRAADLRRWRDPLALTLRALGLDAGGVLLGRPQLWGLAVDGADGVHGVLNQLGAELRTAMALCGTPSLGDISPAILAEP